MATLRLRELHGRYPLFELRDCDASFVCGVTVRLEWQDGDGVSYRALAVPEAVSADAVLFRVPCSGDASAGDARDCLSGAALAARLFTRSDAALPLWHLNVSVDDGRFCEWVGRLA